MCIRDSFMTVRPFTPTVLKDILSEYNPGYTAEDLLALYAFTGGVAKYVQLSLIHICYWIFHRDGDDFDLKVSDPKNPSYLLIACLLYTSRCV